jgi:hypothetical protein
MANNKITPAIAEKFYSTGTPIVQHYMSDGPEYSNGFLDPCDNCGSSDDIREIDGLGKTCLECYAARKKCRSRDCGNWTILAKDGGLCRDCMMGPDEYREAAMEGIRESSMARCESHGITGDYGTDKLARKLRAGMKKLGMGMKPWKNGKKD